MKKIWIFLFLAISAFTSTAQKVAVDVSKASVAPVIDGIEEELWDAVTPNYIERNFSAEDATVTAYWRALWNDTALFILVNVQDDDHYPSWESGGSTWEYDRVELYFDVNDILMDGYGPAYFGSGHYQSAPDFEEYGYDIRQTRKNEGTQFPACQYAYHLTSSSYVIEQCIPGGSFVNSEGKILSMNDLQTLPENMGFDVTVADQDEDITTFRQRKVWQADGNTGTMNEAWNTMDDCGIIALKGGIPVYSTDSVLCDSTEAALVAFTFPKDSVAAYDWDPGDGEILFDDQVSCQVKWKSSGIKHVTLTVRTPSGNTIIMDQDVVVHPKLTVSLGEDFLACREAAVTLVPQIKNGCRPFSYTWNYYPGDSVYNGSFIFDMPVRLSVIDANDCSAMDAVFVYVTPVPVTPSICMVTVDPVTDKNQIVWEKNNDPGCMSYQVMKETKVAGMYEQIGVVPADGMSLFTDTGSEPSRYADRYALINVDTCNNMSTISDPHQPVHLQISQGLPGNYNLSWSPYIGFGYSTYNIYKGKSVDQMVLIDELASSKTQYTDTASSLSYYRVTVRKDFPCSPGELKSTAGEYDEAGSNVVNTLHTGSIPRENTAPFRIYPNPFLDEVTVELELEEPQPVKIELFNMLGEKLYGCTIDVVKPGIWNHLIRKSDLLSESEICLVRVQTADHVFFEKILSTK